MNDESPQLTLARAVGRLEGVIGELSEEIKGLRSDMKSKIDEKQACAIAERKVDEHEKNLHRRTSRDPEKPEATIRINAAFIKRLIPWVFGVGGGGWAGFELINRILGG
jgi:hypothetical protein